MQDAPEPVEILTAVAALMRDTVMPQLSGHSAFLVRVAANAIDLVRRQIEQQSESDAQEIARLRVLLQQDGTLEELNRSLCEAIETGRFNAGTRGLAEHLWATTMSKLAVDQPTYAAYARELARTTR